MSDNMKIIIAILVMVPLTLWLKRFFENFDNYNRGEDSPENKKENTDDKTEGKK